MANKSSSKSKDAAPGQDADVLTSEQVGASAGVASALATVSEQEGDRTAAEKQKGRAKVAKIGNEAKYENKPLTELASMGLEGLQVAFIRLVEAMPRLYNIDFPHEAPLAEVLSGEAADRGALSSTGENPDRVDDAVLPAGTQATDDMLPPNILTGDVPKGFEKHPGVVGAGAGK